MFSALPASEQSWSKGSDSLIIMHISAIWWVPNTGSTESPSTVSIKLHHSPFPFLLSPITACFAFMWETSGVIFSFWSIPAAFTAELLMIVVVSKQYFPFSHTTGNTVFVPLPQTGRDCFPGHSLLERSSLHFSVSKSFVCRCWNGALCIYTFSYKMFWYFTSGVCVCVSWYPFGLCSKPCLWAQYAFTPDRPFSPSAKRRHLYGCPPCHPSHTRVLLCSLTHLSAPQGFAELRQEQSCLADVIN